MSRRQLIFVVLFWAAAAVAVTMALLPAPPHLMIDRFGDKFEHMLAFTTLSLLAVWAFPRAGLWRIGERLSFLGALIEVCQSIPSLHRDCDIRDWFADTVAVVVTLLLVQARRAARGDGAKAPIDLTRGESLRDAARAPGRAAPVDRGSSGSPPPTRRAR